MSLWWNLVSRRRFNLKAFVLSLAAFYCLVMYIFHTDLGSSHDRQRDQMAALVGEDSYIGVQKFQAPPNRRVNLNRMLDSIQQRDINNNLIINKKEVKETKEEVDPYFTTNELLDAAYYNITETKYKEVFLNKGFEEFSNIPPGCNRDGKFLDDKFHQVLPEVYLYSAYWDTRTNDFDNKDSKNIIRMMAIVHRKVKPELECVFPSALPSGRENWDKSSDSIYTPVTYYEMCENHHRQHGGFIISCVVPDFIYTPPCSVNVTFRPKNSVVTLGLRTMKPQANRRKFTICVPPLFGRVPQARIVEYIEMSTLLGASHIIFYTYNVSNDAKLLLDNYVTRTDRVSVIPWLLEKKIDNTIWYHGQSIAIQDCLYRNMATSDYVVFSDIDEFILPRKATYWDDLITGLENETRCAFQFSSAFFDPGNIAMDKEMGLPLQTQTAWSRSERFSEIRAKCIVKPYQIFEAGIHHISKPILAHLQVFRVEPSKAFINHYRTCTRTMGMDCARNSNDYRTMIYRDDLIKRLLVARKEVLQL